MLLLLLRRRSFDCSAATAGTAASAASPFAARGLLQFAGDRGLRLLLRGTGLLRTRSAATLLLALWLLRLLLLLRAFPVALPRLLARALSPLVALALTLAGAAASLFLAAGLAGALLVLADLLLHEPSRLLVEACAQFVMTTVGAALPPLGIGLFAS